MTQARLYDESIQWYALYGLPMTPVPPDYASFKRYWQQMLDEVLEATEISRWYLKGDKALPPPYPWLRGPLWWVLRPLFDRGARWLAVGTLPVEVRDKLGLEWREKDQRRLNRLAWLIRSIWRVLPPTWGYFPQARRAMKNAKATRAQLFS